MRRSDDADDKGGKSHARDRKDTAEEEDDDGELGEGDGNRYLDDFDDEDILWFEIVSRPAIS